MAEWLAAAGAILNGAAAMKNGSGGWSWRRQDMLNERQFARETEYNKPINQVARLREAGLNPNLLYGSISTGNATSGGSSAGSPGGSSFGQRLHALGDTLTSLGDIMGKRQARKEAQQQYKEDRDFLRKDRELDLQLKQIRINQMTQPTPLETDITRQPDLFSSTLRSIPIIGKNYADYYDRRMSAIDMMGPAVDKSVPSQEPRLVRYIRDKFTTPQSRINFLNSLLKRGVIDRDYYFDLKTFLQ